MLLSVKRRFLFIANLKTGSTTVERLLGPFAEIALPDSAFGKHMSLGEALDHFAFLFERAPFEDFRSFAVIRQPAERLFSLYRSHRGPFFEGTPLSTDDMSFEEFLERWLPAHPAQAVAQSTLVKAPSHGAAVRDLIRFEDLNRRLPQLMQRLDIRKPAFRRIPVLNSSSGPACAISTEARQRVEHLYAEDMDLYESLPAW